ncbi:MAG: hypothetical protein Q6366_010395 [Candidatus Freyarchaeota archaeon]
MFGMRTGSSLYTMTGTEMPVFGFPGPSRRAVLTESCIDLTFTQRRQEPTRSAEI